MKECFIDLRKDVAADWQVKLPMGWWPYRKRFT